MNSKILMALVCAWVSYGVSAGDALETLSTQQPKPTSVVSTPTDAVTDLSPWGFYNSEYLGYRQRQKNLKKSGFAASLSEFYGVPHMKTFEAAKKKG